MYSFDRTMRDFENAIADGTEMTFAEKLTLPELRARRESDGCTVLHALAWHGVVPVCAFTREAARLESRDGWTVADAALESGIFRFEWLEFVHLDSRRLRLLADNVNFDRDGRWRDVLGRYFYMDASGGKGRQTFAERLVGRVMKGEIVAHSTLSAADAWGVSLADIVRADCAEKGAPLPDVLSGAGRFTGFLFIRRLVDWRATS